MSRNAGRYLNEIHFIGERPLFHDPEDEFDFSHNYASSEKYFRFILSWPVESNQNYEFTFLGRYGLAQQMVTSGEELHTVYNRNLNSTTTKVWSVNVFF